MSGHRPGIDAGAGAPPPPAPTDPSVRLDAGGGDLVAVSRFEGYATPDAAAAARDALAAAVAAPGSGLAVAEEGAGAFRLAQYGPLFTMETRVNEVMLTVRPV